MGFYSGVRYNDVAHDVVGDADVKGEMVSSETTQKMFMADLFCE